MRPFDWLALVLILFAVWCACVYACVFLFHDPRK